MRVKYLTRAILRFRWLQSVFQMRKRAVVRITGFRGQAWGKQTSILGRLADKYESDKGGESDTGKNISFKPHGYTHIYDLVLNQKRESAKCVLEVGIGFDYSQDPNLTGLDGRNGASLRMWKDYFPSAQIVGFDIREDLQFEEERITTRVVDQLSFLTTTATLEEIHASFGKLDVVIDDGLHTREAHVQTFDAVSPFLAQDSIYIIEDIYYDNLLPCVQHFEDLGLDHYIFSTATMHRKLDWWILIAFPEPRG